MQRKALSASLLALLCAFAASDARAQCVPSTAVSASIGLIEEPFPYTDLEPPLTATEIAALPALPDLTDSEIPGREHVYISTTLAADLGIAPHDSTGGNLTVDPNWQRPNPQIRVRITNPATFSNWQQGTTYRNRASNAVFTVVGVIENSARIIWVYDGLNGTAVEDDSGQYKLFAEDTVNSSGNRVRGIRSFADANSDSLLDTVTANVYCSPVGRSLRSFPNGGTSYLHYSENDASGGRLQETASRGSDRRFALLIPHGGGIEPGTTEQSIFFYAVLGSSVYDYKIPISEWKVEGQWGDDQTAQRWHTTATNISDLSFPSLAWILEKPWYNSTRPFRRAVALHGFESNNLDIIVGGSTSLNAKCHVATKIKEEADTGPLAIRIYHDDEIIDIPADDEHTVCRKGLSGWSSRNIVNRVSADGGIQIEQSRGIRDSTTYRARVAYGTAKAVGDLLKGTAPSNACDVYDDPVDEDLVPDC
jgi:phage replication-related protein YjqB (UPF0714/DUF867 family)